VFDSLAKALASGLSLWESKEARKYQDKLIKIRREYREEVNREKSDDAVLDNFRFELRLISDAFNSQVGE
jgi:hypothetical protein